MKKIRKAVIPAAGPRRVLPFALLTIRNAAHGATFTGRAVFKDLTRGEFCE